MAHFEHKSLRFDPESVPARMRLLVRRRKLLANLLRWRKYAGPLFGVDGLAARLVAEGMLPVALSGWDVGGKESMREVRLICLSLGIRVFTSRRQPSCFLRERCPCNFSPVSRRRAYYTYLLTLEMFFHPRHSSACATSLNRLSICFYAVVAYSASVQGYMKHY
jgi:hypothetical protein